MADNIQFNQANSVVPLEGKSEKFTLPQEEQQRIALLPFAGKVPPVLAQGQKKKAIVFWGATRVG